MMSDGRALRHGLQSLSRRGGGPARATPCRPSWSSADHLRHRPRPRGRRPGLHQLADRAGADAADRLLDRLAPAPEAAAGPAAELRGEAGRDRRRRPRHAIADTEPARRDRPPRHAASPPCATPCAGRSVDLKETNTVDRALRAAGLPRHHRQALHRLGQARRQHAPEHDRAVLRHPQFHRRCRSR